jgi:hypothetical protein
MGYEGILKLAAEFEDRAVRKEIHDVLRTIKAQVSGLHGEDLVLLRNYLKKIVEY